MKLKLAFKYLPYILIEKDIGEGLGKSKAFIVWLDEKTSDTTDEHEEVHILFWYTITMICSTILYLIGLPLYYVILFGSAVEPLMGTYIKSYNVFEESFAYARAAALKPSPEAYLYNLSKSKVHTNKYGADFVNKVRKRIRWFT